ncbi:MAG: cell division protein FtsA [Epsilonproteobacteria bacterium]|nr:cell division protein FtsA [Campylobacterota bacterium]
MLADHFTAIDIGTTKICVLIGKVDSKNNIEILGIGHHPSYGLKKGVVTDIGQTVNSIKSAINQAEEMAGVRVETATVGISGGHIKSFNSTGVVAIKNKEVSQTDIDRVIDAAKAIPIPEDQYILHILPQYFRIDGQEYVFDSLGMYGVRLEAQVHIVTGAVSSAQNIIKACELAGIIVGDIVLEQIASADAVLTQAEREMGVGILDIGGGTSDFAIYKDGRIRHSKVIPLAGNHFTNDIAVGLNIPFKKAEALKRMYGSASQYTSKEQPQNEYLKINLGYEGGIKHIARHDIDQILYFRAEEILDMLADEIVQYRLKAFMPSGLVLTGGGSLLAHLKDLASQKLSMATRIGTPESLQEDMQTAIPDVIKSPIYSTAYGLLLYAIKDVDGKEIIKSDHSVFTGVMKRMKSWIYDFF